MALEQAGERTPGATMFVTLEPCAHRGKTPPCTTALIEAGISRVVVGAVDPDPRVAGKGIEELEAAGIEVEVGLLAAEVHALDPGYFRHRSTGQPAVTLKSAATLDGQVAADDGTSQWITSESARQDGHALRAAADAVMVGAGTLLADDPRLTIRLDGYVGPQPVPVIVAGSRGLPPDAAALSGKALIYSTEPMDLPAEVVVVPAGGRGVDLEAVLRDLAARGHFDVLVEGGPTLNAQLLKLGLVQRGVLYLAGLVAGGIGLGVFREAFPTLGSARKATIVSVATIGPDLRIDYELGDG